jgi:L-asparaginase II
VTRGGIVESLHHVAACAVDENEAVIFAMGDVGAPVYLRSSAKPFIAAAAVEAGVRERFGLTGEEIAVMAASHSGQPYHVAAVRSILSKIGMDESALQCGIHAPYNAQAAAELQEIGVEPAAVHNNCSGKHAGILALCAVLGADPATYLNATNPAERRILALCARVSDQPVEELHLGVDGCGIPVYATPLRNAAISFMRFATLSGIDDRDAAALAVVRDAMIAHPEYVAGTGEFDSRLIATAKGRIACKGGAEGVHGSAVIDRRAGLALKVIDGASRARAPAVLALLRRLDLAGESVLREMEDLERPVVYNRAGRAVGQIRASNAVAIS